MPVASLLSDRPCLRWSNCVTWSPKGWLIGPPCGRSQKTDKAFCRKEGCFLQGVAGTLGMCQRECRLLEDPLQPPVGCPEAFYQFSLVGSSDTSHPYQAQPGRYSAQ